jgi:hypothetical protein
LVWTDLFYLELKFLDDFIHFSVGIDVKMIVRQDNGDANLAKFRWR